MTTTAEPTTPPSPGSRRPSRPRRWPLLLAAGVLLAAALGVGLGFSLNSSGTTAGYRYYQSVMGRFGGGAMMGSAGPVGYGWMMGGSQAPGWMAGSDLPGYMMGSGADPGEIMGSLFADAPGPRVSTAEAARLASVVPAGATVDRAARQISFKAGAVAFAVVASPPGADDMFEVAGVVNPTIVVPVGAAVSVQFVNADTSSAHGLVVVPTGSADTWMPMATAQPAFPGAAAWFLGNAGSAGAHLSTLTFHATTAGSYRYICPVPGHAQKGMAGTLTVGG